MPPRWGSKTCTVVARTTRTINIPFLRNSPLRRTTRITGAGQRCPNETEAQSRVRRMRQVSRRDSRSRAHRSLDKPARINTARLWRRSPHSSAAQYRCRCRQNHPAIPRRRLADGWSLAGPTPAMSSDRRGSAERKGAIAVVEQPLSSWRRTGSSEPPRSATLEQSRRPAPDRPVVARTVHRPYRKQLGP